LQIKLKLLFECKAKMYGYRAGFQNQVVGSETMGRSNTDPYSAFVKGK